jgi:predicted RNA-binding Zn-ribbon protein involved in translation (DUF1610 family)
MKPKLKESGLAIIPDKNDKSTMPDDGLHAFVCPHCGNNVFDGKDIECYELHDGSAYCRCLEGFGIKRYKWIPHKCTACGAKFIAWTSEKSLNGKVIACYILLALAVVFGSAIIVAAITMNPGLWFLWIPEAFLILACISGIESETLDADKGVTALLDRVDFPSDKPKRDSLNIALKSLASACAVTPNQMRDATCALATMNLYDPATDAVERLKREIEDA